MKIKVLTLFPEMYDVLNVSIVGKAIQKICDSFRINDGWKTRFKELRKKYK